MPSTTPTTERAPFTTSQTPLWSTTSHTTSRGSRSSSRTEWRCTTSSSTTLPSSPGCPTPSSTLTSILPVSGSSTLTTNSATTRVQEEHISASGCVLPGSQTVHLIR